jgi:dTDP-4-dehydrorhamnose reductase
MNKIILLTGASGNIGKKILNKLKKYNCYGIYFRTKINYKNIFKCDLRNEKKLKLLIKKIKPNIVIHLAAMPNPSSNEKYPVKSKQLNINITKNLIKNLTKKTHFIFFSTDKVYTGIKKSYSEKSETVPTGLYAKYKLKNESIIRKKFKKNHIFRMSVVHSNGINKNFSIIDKQIFSLKKKLNVKIFNNVKRCFVDVDELANFLPVILNGKKFGTYNIGANLCSYANRVKKICINKKINFKKNLIAIKGNVKPISMKLDTKKSQKHFKFKFN